MKNLLRKMRPETFAFASPIEESKRFLQERNRRKKALPVKKATASLKHRLFFFVTAAGLPVSFSYAAGSGCTGLCGSCQGTCLPTFAMLLFLGGKVGYVNLKHKLRQRVSKTTEKDLPSSVEPIRYAVRTQAGKRGQHAEASY